MTYQKNQGFTLMEVLIVVAILGVLASVAYMSYSSQVISSNRSDAKSALNDVSQRLQRCYTTYSAFNNDDCGVYDDLKDGGAIRSSEGLYEITAAVDATTFTLTATAIRAPQLGDQDCNVNDQMELTHTGRRTPAECW